MKKAKVFVMCLIVFSIPLVMKIQVLRGAEKEYKFTVEEFLKAKADFDDPRPVLKDMSFKKMMPPEVYGKLIYDVEEMKKLWAECIGFKSPDEVGKIAPEIKPGKYSYMDKGKYPGLKELMIPAHYEMFNPGKSPHAGNFPEIEVVPTRQYYWSTPIAKATKENMGRTKLDSEGYINNDTYVAGYPFPRPSGGFKGQQIMYNWEKRYFSGENFYMVQRLLGFTKGLGVDFDGGIYWLQIRLHGRAMFEPYGWYDKRAQDQKEATGVAVAYFAPRDSFGNAFNIVYYLDRDRFDNWLLYINSLRRVRKMTATDCQDAVGGQDVIYEDRDGFSQKLSPKRYPYKFEVIAEREYLVPAPTWDGSLYMTSPSKGLELRNIQFERRPVYVVQLTQQDPNYVYSKRIIYFDKETFNLLYIENYDQKKRLYRNLLMIPCFNPEMGLLLFFDYIMRDFLDLHSGRGRGYTLPAPWVTRDHIDMSGIVKMGK